MRDVEYDVVIVGAGHAGAQTAITLRQAKFAGTIAVVGEEPELPYERPPLSKDYLSGEKAFERILIHQPAFWRDRAIEFLTSERVVAVDPQAHVVSTHGGRRIGYGRLVWAAGGRPRRLSCAGHDLAGVHAVRTRADVDRLLADLGPARDVVVIGGGYIGLEAAAVLAKLGKSVTVVEAQDRVLARVSSGVISRFYEAEHRAHGVKLLLSEIVTCIEGTNGTAAGVRLSGGRVLPAQIVIVGIGIVPAVEPLLASGATGDNGVTVDAQCRTSLSDVFAVGDCAAHANRFAAGAVIRLESVQNASDQASVAARTIVGEDVGYDSVPWFWSNQYDLKLQTIGLSIGHDAALLRGDPATRAFTVVYLRGGRVTALDCVNSVRDYVQGSALVVAGARVDPVKLADTSRPLKELCAGQARKRPATDPRLK